MDVCIIGSYHSLLLTTNSDTTVQPQHILVVLKMLHSGIWMVNFVHNTLLSNFSLWKCFRYLSVSSSIYSCPSSSVYFNICLNSYKSLIIIIYSKSVLKFYEPLMWPFFSFFGKPKKAKLVLLYIIISYNKLSCLLSP